LQKLAEGLGRRIVARINGVKPDTVLWAFVRRVAARSRSGNNVHPMAAGLTYHQYLRILVARQPFQAADRLESLSHGSVFRVNVDS